MSLTKFSVSISEMHDQFGIDLGLTELAQDQFRIARGSTRDQLEIISELTLNKIGIDTIDSRTQG